MPATPSTMLPLNTVMPEFQLPDFTGNLVSSEQLGSSPAFLMIFMCTHCPFVQHIRSGIARFAEEYQPRGLTVVAINSNDTELFPQDGPEGMEIEAKTMGYRFPYLIDETQ